MSAITLTRRAVGYLFHPQHADGMREFLVTIKHEGKTYEQTVWARTSFGAIESAQDQYGLDCSFKAKAL